MFKLPEETLNSSEDKDIKSIQYKILKAQRGSVDKLSAEYAKDSNLTPIAIHEEDIAGHEEDKEVLRKMGRINRAGEILQWQLPREVIKFYGKDLNKVDTKAKLSELLKCAISCKDVVFLEKLLSEFKSGEDKKFGDYINGGSYIPLEHAYEGGSPEVVELLLKHKADPKLLSIEQIKVSLRSHSTKKEPEKTINEYYDAFFYSTDGKIEEKDEIEFKKQLRVILNDRYSDGGTEKDYIKIKKLLLQYGTDRDEIVKTFNYNATDLIKGPFLPWGGNNEIKRIVIRHGAVDGNYTVFNIASAAICSLLTVRFAILGASSSPWFFIGAAVFIIPASISIYNVLNASIGYISPTEPSPKFVVDEVESGKATVLEQA